MARPAKQTEDLKPETQLKEPFQKQLKSQKVKDPKPPPAPPEKPGMPILVCFLRFSSTYSASIFVFPRIVDSFAFSVLFVLIFVGTDTIKDFRVFCCEGWGVFHIFFSLLGR